MTNELARDLSALADWLRAITVNVIDGRRGAGSGVLWDADGLIVTNAHVVRSRRASIVLPGGRRASAHLVRRDDTLDLAALQLDEAGPSQHAVVRDSATVVPGELAVAVGNPLGLTGALTAGLVQRSNGRWVVADVRLAPGNSGGPLADTRGRVIGINSMVAGSLGFAVASSVVQAFLTGSRAKAGRAA